MPTARCIGAVEQGRHRTQDQCQGYGSQEQITYEAGTLPIRPLPCGDLAVPQHGDRHLELQSGGLGCG